MYQQFLRSVFFKENWGNCSWQHVPPGNFKFKLKLPPGLAADTHLLRAACRRVNAPVVFLCFYFVVRLSHRSRAACRVPCKRSFIVWVGLFLANKGSSIMAYAVAVQGARVSVAIILCKRVGRSLFSTRKDFNYLCFSARQNGGSADVVLFCLTCLTKDQYKGLIFGEPLTAWPQTMIVIENPRFRLILFAQVISSSTPYLVDTLWPSDTT